MFVVSKRNIILPGPNGEKFRMAKDYMGPVPAWAEDSAYLNALVKDGKVILSANGSDKDFAAHEKKRKKSKAPAKPTEGPDECPDEEQLSPDGQSGGDQEETP